METVKYGKRSTQNVSLESVSSCFLNDITCLIMVEWFQFGKQKKKRRYRLWSNITWSIIIWLFSPIIAFHLLHWPFHDFPPYNGSSLKCMVHPSHHLSLLFQLFSISSTSPYLYVIRINLLGVTMFWGLQISYHIPCHYFVTTTSTPIYFLPNFSAVISYEVQSFKCEIKKRTIISVLLVKSSNLSMVGFIGLLDKP